MNKTMLIGHIGQDAQVFENKKNLIVRAQIATSEWNGKEEETEWHSLVVFGKKAETAKEVMKKGARIYVEGTLKYPEYKGEKRPEIQVREIEVQKLPPALQPVEERKAPPQDSPTPISPYPPLKPASVPLKAREKDFSDWMRRLSEVVRKSIGISVDQLPEMPTRDWYENGLSPDDALREVQNCLGAWMMKQQSTPLSERVRDEDCPW